MAETPTTSEPKAEPAASLTTISVRRTRPDPVPEPVRRETDVALPTPINDDTPPRAAFGTRSMRDACETAETPGDPPPPARAAVAPSAIIDLWEHLAAQRLRPEISDLDAHLVARQWPNSLLLRVRDNARRPALEVAHMFVPTAGGPTIAIPIDAMTVDWIVALGREVVSTRSPVHETDAVPTNNGAINCGVIVLPFGPQSRVDHVLCHLYRVDEMMLEGTALADTRIATRDRTGIRRLFGR